MSYPTKLDPDRCSEIVACRSIRMSYHQCNNKIVKDGFCRMHHPDAVKARQDEAQRKYNEKWENSPVMRLKKANERITELEAEIERLKNQ